MDKFTAAASIRTLAVQYQSMVEAADALESIGKLEQITKEQTTQADMARADADTAKVELKKAKVELKKAKDKATDIVATANDQALAKLQEADQKAQAILDGAAAQANGMISAAVDKAEQAAAPVAGQVAQLTSTKVGLEQDIATLNQTALAKQSEVEALEARLAKVQAAIAKYVG
jgi:F0F1-type ATP synthase membrane subunit b/b'